MVGARCFDELMSHCGIDVLVNDCRFDYDKSMIKW